MIYVDRKHIPRPAFFDGSDFRGTLQRWARFHNQGGIRGRKEQSRFDLEEVLSRVSAEAMNALRGLFRDKCAYSEEPLGGEGTIVFHRPLGDALGLDGEVAPEHYWWLLGDWSNWYLASPQVASAKGPQFPVVGPRAQIGAERAGEKPIDDGLLLDPCVDSPSWHLVFLEDGTVAPRRALDLGSGSARPSDRGAETILVLDLNRKDLVSQRTRARSAADAAWERLRSDLHPLPTSDEWFVGVTRQLLARRLVHDSGVLRRAAAPREVLARLADEIGVELLEPDVPPLPQLEDEWLEPIRAAIAKGRPELVGNPEVERRLGGLQMPSTSVAISTTDQPQASKRPAAPRTARAAAPSASPTASLPVIERSARLTEIRIRNFKAIEDVHLEIPTAPVTVRTPYGSGETDNPNGVAWVALLGENGCGKSCLLQAIGLALAGDGLSALVRAHKLRWSRMLRRGASEGRIELGFLGGQRIALRFDARRHWWIGGKPRIHAFVRGYGATRLVDGGATDAESLRAQVRLDNLFRPTAPVVDAESWLLGLDEGDFNAAALTVGDLIRTQLRPGDPAAPEKPRLVRDLSRRQVLVEGDPLDEVSDGYRAVVSMACDLLAGLGTGFADHRNAPGIVLIDEIGSHLHPRWRMEITSSLRRALPRIQVIASTHEPLCLRGFLGPERGGPTVIPEVGEDGERRNPPGEVVRVRRPFLEDASSPEHRRVTLDRVDRSPSQLRVDQLLTSEFFGLDTTVDPDLDLRFQAYYRLLATPDEQLTPQLRAELERLRAELHRLSSPALGHTRRDQLVYEAIDEFLAIQDRLDPEARRARRRATIEAVQQIWSARRKSMGIAGGTA